MNITHKQILFLVFMLFLNIISSNSFEKLVNKYEGLIEDMYVDEKTGELRAKREINTNKQILIIPTRNIMSSEEKYQFEEYFGRSTKEKLIGRLLIERFIGEESFFHEYIERLQKPSDLIDYYHYNDHNKKELNRRNLIKYSFSDRKAEYDALITKIPSNVIISLNFRKFLVYYLISNCTIGQVQ